MSLCFCPWTIFSQTEFQTRDSVYLFWQPENRIVYNDYKCPSLSNDIHAEIALWTVMDLPQNSSALRPGQMNIYIAPVCNRHYSRAHTNDSTQITVDNIYFDILELSAREARIKISRMADSVMNVEHLSKAFKVIVYEMHENRLKLNRKFYKEMFRDKKTDAIQTWQQWLSQALSNTAKWSTKPIECYRFLKNKPLESGYSEDLSSNALLIDRYEQVLDRNIWHAEFLQISRLRK